LRLSDQCRKDPDENRLTLGNISGVTSGKVAKLPLTQELLRANTRVQPGDTLHNKTESNLVPNAPCQEKAAGIVRYIAH